MTGLIAAILLSAALSVASSVFAPLALAIFIIAIVRPLHARLQAHMPQTLALFITISITVAVFLIFATLFAWGFGRVGRWFTSDGARMQVIYDQLSQWLEGRGVSMEGIWAEHFNTSWVIRAIQQVTGRINTTLTFWLVVLVYVILGLLEVGDMRRKAEALRNQAIARILIEGTQQTAAKFRRYMLVRTQMSTMTGLLVWLVATMAGLRFSAEWGVIAFVLNYIPFIGPVIATIIPALFAWIQFGEWQPALAILIALNAVQFIIGNYVEPRVSGTALSLSPMLVLFSVFFWTYLWGLIGTFIGVPITIAILTFCAQHPSSRWVADLLGDPGDKPAKDTVADSGN